MCKIRGGNKNPTYIELFAGCGGFSLGLDSAGFERIFANELSPMAAETYAYNLLSEDLRTKGEANQPSSLRVAWLSSRYPPEQIENRLKENPNEYPPVDGGYSDILMATELKDLQGKLLIGDIKQLNEFIRNNSVLREQLLRENIDLVSGGPPCQSFSIAGLRQHDNERNSLPMEFADFVSLVRPKIVAMENVSGILRAFTVPGSGRYYAWFEVAKAFAMKGYYPVCLHVNAKYVGVPQNRPRFLMLAFRKDLFTKLKEDGGWGDGFCFALDQTWEFAKKIHAGSSVRAGIDLTYHDLERNKDLYSERAFSHLMAFPEGEGYNVGQAIGDLYFSSWPKAFKSSYLEYVDTRITCPSKRPKECRGIHNIKLRANGLVVKQRFLLFQYLSEKEAQGPVEANIRRFLRGADLELSDMAMDFLLAKRFLLPSGEFVLFSKKIDLWLYLRKLVSKKHSQKALIEDQQAPVTLSIPDDVCHYRRLRTLSVREMARMQSFPDWFVFRGKPTTGGDKRKYEVPQYTQVGNSVPPLLGAAIGLTIQKFLKYN